MALIRPNNRALQNITTLPTGITNYNLTSADLPSGTTIQTQRGAITSAVQGNGDFDIMNVNITPVLPDSNILITVYVQWSVSGNNGDDWGMRLYRNSDIILGESIQNYFISGGGVDAYDNPFFAIGASYPEFHVRFAQKTDLDTSRPTGTSTINYKLSRYANAANKTVAFQTDGWGGTTNGESQRSNCVIIAQEIVA